jgi:hypothetical protein
MHFSAKGPHFLKPTLQISAMRWLVEDAKPNDSLFFHCMCASLSMLVYRGLYCYLDSGHGGQTKDLDGDEDDGYDEGASHFLDPDFLSTGVCQLSTP